MTFAENRRTKTWGTINSNKMHAVKWANSTPHPLPIITPSTQPTGVFDHLQRSKRVCLELACSYLFSVLWHGLLCRPNYFNVRYTFRRQAFSRTSCSIKTYKAIITRQISNPLKTFFVKNHVLCLCERHAPFWPFFLFSVNFKRHMHFVVVWNMRKKVNPVKQDMTWQI